MDDILFELDNPVEARARREREERERAGEEKAPKPLHLSDPLWPLANGTRRMLLLPSASSLPWHASVCPRDVAAPTALSELCKTLSRSKCAPCNINLELQRSRSHLQINMPGIR